MKYEIYRKLEKMEISKNNETKRMYKKAGYSKEEIKNLVPSIYAEGNFLDNAKKYLEIDQAEYSLFLENN